MGDFLTFKKTLQKQFDKVVEGEDRLFKVDVDKDALWDAYLSSFPEGTNNLYRERQEYDCNACKRFIREAGNIVAIKDNQLVTIWDSEEFETPFSTVAEKLSALVKNAHVRDAYVTKESNIGVDKNRELEDGNAVVWEHLFYKLPVRFINKSSRSNAEVNGAIRDSKNVFMRSMEELTEESAQIVLELIDQNSLYRGSEFKASIAQFLALKQEYNALPVSERENWCWLTSTKTHISKLRNSAIGTLLVDLSENMEVDTAVSRYEKIVAPENYKRPKAIFTKRMVEEAEKTVKELGLENSLARKAAVLEDITVNNVLFVNRDAQKKLSNSVFDELKEEVPVNPKSFNRIEEVSIKDFIDRILPNSSNIELLVEGKHTPNFVGLVAPADKEAPSILKWDNNFSWSYNGDVADSMKENVKKAGGKVDGVLRFSIQWNDKGDTHDDYDAHCIEPSKNRIYFGSKFNVRTGGNLDVDIMHPVRNVAVENITWPSVDRMLEGEYVFFVHNYANRGGKSGFTAEIEFNGTVYSFNHPEHLRTDQVIEVARVTYSKANGFELTSSMDNSVSSVDFWGVTTNQFTKVSVCMLSPNHWDGQTGKGPKHYFFFLEGCKSETAPRGFYNEFLNPGLNKHRKVFEALGSKMRVPENSEGLCGLGFHEDKRNSILAKVEGAINRTVKINF